MKKTAIFSLVCLVVGFLALALAQDVDPSQELAKAIERGKALFNDTSLGTSEMSCNSCHKAGGTEDSKMGDMNVPAWDNLKAQYPKYFAMAKRVMTLDQIVNVCLVQAMKGEALNWDSQKLTDLTAYCASVKK